MVKYIFVCLGLLIALGATAQVDSTNGFQKNGLIQSAGTISPGFMQSYNQQNIFVGGHLEYFPEEHVSIRGDGYWFVSSVNNPALLKQNSMLLYGVLYHFAKTSRADFFTGFEPGATLTQPKLKDAAGNRLKLKVTPAITLLAGFNYLVWDYIYFFADVRYVNSRYFQNVTSPIALHQFIFSGGLGFQLPTKRKKG